MEISIKLSQKELDLIGLALQELPYKHSAPLIIKLGTARSEYIKQSEQDGLLSANND